MSELSVHDVVDFILENKGEHEITHRKLQKLLYFCQGLYLAQEGVSLFEERIEAWEFGPVCPNIYHDLKHHGFHPLSASNSVDKSKYTKKVAALILGVITTFGSFSKDELIEFSHIDSPWASNYIQYKNNELKKDELKDYFSSFSKFTDYISYQDGRKKFKSLIQDRRAYLKELQNLGDNWLSSPSLSPNEMTTLLSSQILSTVRNLVNQTYNSPIPKLIMGPIPSGGVGIELVINEGKKLFVNVYNNETVEFDIENSGYFTEEDSSIGDAVTKFQKIYMELV